MKTVPNIGDEVYVLEGDGSSTLIKIFKIRHLADRGGNKTQEAGMYCDLVIWGQEIEDSKAEDSDFI